MCLTYTSFINLLLVAKGVPVKEDSWLVNSSLENKPVSSA